MTEGDLFRTVLAMAEAGDANAEAHLMAELRRRGDDPAAWADAGALLMRFGKWDESLVCFQQAASRGGADVGALMSLGSASYLAGKFAQSTEYFLALLQQDAKSGESWRGLAAAFAAQGRYGEARHCLGQATTLLPAMTSLRDQLWRLDYQFGQWDAAWQEFATLLPDDLAARWQSAFGTQHRPWCGEDLTGQELVILCHGGHGDTIQHFRWIAKLLAAWPDLRITAFVQPALVRLLSESPAAQAGAGRLSVLATGSPITGHAGFFTSWEGLAWQFKAQPGRAGHPPYLAAAAERRAHWRDRLGQEPLVALSWSGSPGMPLDHWRSIPLAALSGVFAAVGCRLVAVQKGPLPEADRAILRQANILDPSEAIGDFADTAALLSLADLVIAVDSAVAHLAGALGIETWLLNRATSEWRWGWQQATSFWYPTMRIFNQAVIRDWSGVANVLGLALAERYPPRHSPR